LQTPRDRVVTDMQLASPPPTTTLATTARATLKPAAVPVSAVRILSICALALVALYAYGLTAMYGQTPGWLIGGNGLPRANEYLGVRAAGDMALLGHAAGAYDWAAHEVVIVATTKTALTGYYPFPYPPTYFFVATALASLPFLLSAFLWITVTLSLYAWSVARIARARVTALWAIASPATVFNAFVAHTGFWTAAAMGFALETLPRRPILAGVLFGLLTQKPQLGILIPVALIAGGYWRTCLAAGATAGLLACASLAAFGMEPWLLYPTQMSLVSDSVRFGTERFGSANMNLLVSSYGFLRTCGVPEPLALKLQLAVGTLLAVGVALLWRSRAPFALKAAGLTSASLLATPYLFIYDLTHLSVAIAFLVRHTQVSGLSRAETVILACSILMILLAAFVPLPVAFLANAVIGIVIAQRISPYLKHQRARPLAQRPAATNW
jgi:arabinofuranan 3-O-arabinosyltransferase